MNKLQQIHEELCCQYNYEEGGKTDTKDIIIVVHDQLDFMIKCAESLYKHTENFTLYIWDNNSQQPTKEYLEKLSKDKDNVVLIQHPENSGFLKPNNELVKLGTSDYIILLNSDTEVKQGWDTALIAWLRNHPNCKISGYEGGLLEANAKGAGMFSTGYEVDYIAGWCLCMERKTYNQYGLFDGENLSFAYCEDSDLSLRMKEKGFDIYALNMSLVTHFGNATVKAVQKEMNTSITFENNHKYMRERHKDYLAHKRVLVSCTVM